MLFDLEDYKVAGITGVVRKSVENIYWGDPYITWRATHDAYRKAVNEWFLASNVMASAEDKHQLMVNYININDKFTDSFRKGKIFFNALISKSIPAEIVSANGITEGATLRIFTVHESEGYYNEFIDLPNLEYAWGNGWKYVLFIGEDSPNGYSELTGRGESFVYTTMTQAIYNAHKNALVDLQAKIKETYIIAEGISDIPEWIEPDVHPWYDSAELSGYVRDSRSLPISGAKVRLVDAEGVNHDLVTNDLGYYHFTKEYIYNNISLGTASSAEFDMFVLEETISGTLLYSQTSIYQNSFFGALNDRGISWPVLVKSGKQNRRNFKLEFLPDYSNYPSFSGHVIDADGNPVQNVLMEIYHRGLDKKLTETSSTSNTINSTKFSLFGENKSLLTDENGYYEYPSQYVGEWFNKWKVAQEYEREFNLDAYNVIKGFSYDSDFMKHNGAYSGISNGNFYSASSLLGNLGEAYFTMPYWDKSVLYEGNWINQNSIIIKFDQNGVLDTSYMENIQISDIPVLQAETSTSTHVKLLKQSDGKIIVYGRFMDTVHGYKCLMRLNHDGTVDTTFDGSFFESVFTDYSAWKIENNWVWNTFEASRCGIVQDDDKIILAGFLLSGNQFGVLRFNADGTLDDTFVGGLTKTGESVPESIELQSDGKILLGGLSELTYKDRTSSEDPYMIIRLNTDGTLDDTFNLGRDLNGNKRMGTINSQGYTVLSMKSVSDGVLIGGYIQQFWTDNGAIPIPDFLKLTTTGGLVEINMGGSIGQTTYGNDGHGYSYVVDIEVVEDRVLISDNNGTYILRLSDGAMDFEKVSSGRLINGQGSQISVEGSSILVKGHTAQINDSISNNWQGTGFVKFNYENLSVIKNGLEVGVLDSDDYDFSLNSTQLNLDPYGNYHVTADDVEVFVNPFIQNKESGEIIGIETETAGHNRFYDHLDYFNSRFELGYFLTEGKEYKFIRHIEQNNVLNCNETLVDAEIGAEKAFIDYKLIQGNTNYYLEVSSTTGYVRCIFDDGTKNVYGSGNNSGSFNVYTPSDYDSNGELKSFYIYSCNIYGAAEGKITYMYISSLFGINIDELTGLKSVNINEVYDEVDVIDFTGNELNSISINSNYRKVRIIGLSPNLSNVSLSGGAYTNKLEYNDYVYNYDIEDVYDFTTPHFNIQSTGNKVKSFKVGDKIAMIPVDYQNFSQVKINDNWTEKDLLLNGPKSIVLLDNHKNVNQIFDAGSFNSSIESVSYLNGRYLVTGNFGYYNPMAASEPNFCLGLAVLNPNGSFYSTFSDNFMNSTSDYNTHLSNYIGMGYLGDRGISVSLVLETGEVILGTKDGWVIKVSSTGTILESINIPKVIDSNFSTTADIRYNIRGISLTDNGEYIVYGDSLYSELNVLYKLDSDLTISSIPDLRGDFSTGLVGFVNHFSTEGNKKIYDIAIQNDGKMIIVGDFGYVLSEGVFSKGIIRLNSDFTPDSVFHENLFDTGIYSQTDADNSNIRNIKSVLIDGENIIIGGSFKKIGSVKLKSNAILNLDGTIVSDLGDFSIADSNNEGIYNIQSYNNGLLIDYPNGQYLSKKAQPWNVTRLVCTDSRSNVYIRKSLRNELLVNVSLATKDGYSSFNMFNSVADKVNINLPNNSQNYVYINQSSIKELDLNNGSVSQLDLQYDVYLENIKNANGIINMLMPYGWALKPSVFDFSSLSSLQNLNYSYDNDSTEIFSMDLSGLSQLNTLNLGYIRLNELVLPSNLQNCYFYSVKLPVDYDYSTLPESITDLQIGGHGTVINNLFTSLGNNITKFAFLQCSFDYPIDVNISDKPNLVRINISSITNLQSITLSNLPNLNQYYVQNIYNDFTESYTNVGSSTLSLDYTSIYKNTIDLTQFNTITGGNNNSFRMYGGNVVNVIAGNNHKFERVVFEYNNQMILANSDLANLVKPDTAKEVRFAYNKYGITFSSEDYYSLLNSIPHSGYGWITFNHWSVSYTNQGLILRQSLISKGWNIGVW